MIPTTKQISEQNLTNYENRLVQKSPVLTKSFLRVMSIVDAMLGTSLYRFGMERISQNFIRTATELNLDKIGLDLSVPRKPASATRLTVRIDADTGASLSSTNGFTGDSNGVSYSIDAPASESGGFIDVAITSKELGATGNLNITDTLTLQNPVSGVASSGEVLTIDSTGADAESDVDYRVRLLDAKKNKYGGGNPADYRFWSEEVAGVRRAYPYAGRPDQPSSTPPERTVFIECQTDISPDGVPPAGLLTNVRDHIITDENGQARQTLGATNSTLYVLPIYRTSIDVIITNLVVNAGSVASCESDIEDALDVFFRSMRAYIDGLDVEFEKADAITDVSVSKIVQDVISNYGGKADSVDLEQSGTPFTSYVLDAGELVGLGAVSYV